MSIGFLFWLIMVVSLLFGLWSNWPANKDQFPQFGGRMLEYVLFFLLGWKVFGFVIQG